MSEKQNQDFTFNHKLVYAFSGIAVILILSVTLSLYLYQQQHSVVNESNNKILPESLASMRLSEQSALLAAFAPTLSNSRNQLDIEHTFSTLDGIIKEINDSSDVLKGNVEDLIVDQIGQNIALMTTSLINLKKATSQKIQLANKHKQTLKLITHIHNELEDTINPVVWGVASLSRLMGKRVIRQSSEPFIRQNQEQQTLLSELLLLKFNFFQLKQHAAASSSVNQPLQWKNFIVHLNKTFSQFSIDFKHKDKITEYNFSDRNTEITQIIEKKLEDELDKQSRKFKQQFDLNAKNMKNSIDEFIGDTTNNMHVALDIKAEGNLLFALLSAVSEANSSDKISNLNNRFQRSRTVYNNASKSFLGSELSKRNPILAETIRMLKQRIAILDHKEDGIFSIRHRQLINAQEIETLLTTNRKVATQLKQQTEAMILNQRTASRTLIKRLEKGRKTNSFILIAVSSLGLVLTFLIAYTTIRTLGRHAKELRQAATVFNSTSEGIFITDTESRIITINKAFTQIYGYEEDEVIGKKTSILSSGRHEKNFYRQMWTSLQETGSWQGDIYNKRKNGEIFPEWLNISSVIDKDGQIIQYVSVFSDITIVKKSLEKMDHMAHHDSLTDLPNRLLLHDRLDHALLRAKRDQNSLAILFLDLDRFKMINDTMGHDIGDRLLKEVAQRLTACVRQSDTVARLGGDEFMIIMEELSSDNEPDTVAQHILDSFKSPFYFDKDTFFVTTSIGLSLCPDNGTTVNELIKNADVAMYHAKAKGKNNYQYYSCEMSTIAVEAVKLEANLRQAIKEEEFILYYQPQFDLHSNEITGVEALLRWQHPQKGILTPDQFLSTAEESGLIIPIGTWVLNTACMQAKQWFDLTGKKISMAVNLSGKQINNEVLISSVTQALKTSHIDPGSLELEITEGFIMQNPEQSISLFNELRDMEISLGIDDFGTGHSSLSYLKRLPVQTLKIDRSFVRDIPEDMDDSAITRAIIALGHSLNMSIVAEGVEVKEQQDFLIAEGCDKVQGYLYSRPLPADQVLDLLESL
ncbi:MAG: EAL domain-containing protein [gamma proteobacterium symbiont of Taylorina sp.]|nr:EAL domain-containing protein [gamma proteobacterium symbiont of Taylorina sp.]